MGLLAELPDELFDEFAAAALERDLPSALYLRQTCKQFRRKLEGIKEEAEKRRLQWLPEMAGNHTITSGRRTIINRTGFKGFSWAATQPLPTSGKSTWRMRVDFSKHNRGEMLLGVCLEDASDAWSLDPSDGRLTRCSRMANGEYTRGYPHGHENQVLRTVEGESDDLWNRANGAVIAVLVDHDAGILATDFSLP